MDRAAAKTRRIFLAQVGAGLSLLGSWWPKPSLGASQPGWIALLDDRTGLANWDPIGEVNIFDNRPDPSYGTGAIVAVAKVNPMPRAAGRWNVYEITAQGDRLTVTLNGV